MNRRNVIKLLAVVTVVPMWPAQPAAASTKTPILYADGYHDDTAALEAWFRGESVHWSDGMAVGDRISYRRLYLPNGINAVSGRRPRIFTYNEVLSEPISWLQYVTEQSAAVGSKCLPC